MKEWVDNNYNESNVKSKSLYGVYKFEASELKFHW